MASWEVIAKESEDILAKPDIKGCYEYLQKAYEGGATHPEVLWRLGRANYEMAEESTDAKVQEPYLVKGLELVQKSVDEDGNNFASHKWLGILLSSQHVSTKEKIANAYKIKEQFLKAVELNPKDATSLHCMGNWCFSVLKVSWIERKAASLLFGEPPSSTPEECLKYLLASAEAGDTIHNAKMIGDVYKQEGNKEEAKKWYQKAMSMPADTALKKRNHDAAEKALKHL